MTPVTARPVRKPSIRLVVSFPRSPRREEPARRSSASPIRFMPNRNRHSPPIMVRTLKISMDFDLSHLKLFHISILSAQGQIHYQKNVKSA